MNILYHFSCTSVICVLQQFTKDCAAGFVPITYILQRGCEQLDLCVLLYWLRDSRSHVVACELCKDDQQIFCVRLKERDGALSKEAFESLSLVSDIVALRGLLVYGHYPEWLQKLEMVG